MAGVSSTARRKRNQALSGTPRTVLGVDVGQVHGDQAEASATQKQVRGAQGLFDLPAAHPQQLFELHAGGLRGMRIETVASVHQGAHLGLGRSGGQGRKQQAGPARAGRTANLRQPAARQPSGQQINLGQCPRKRCQRPGGRDRQKARVCAQPEKIRHESAER